MGQGRRRPRRGRAWLVALGAVALVAPVTAQTAGAQAPPSAHVFATHPELRPPTITVHTPAQDTEPGYIFLTPLPGAGGSEGGPLIVDNAGQPVWFLPVPGADLSVQEYRGAPVLTWWSGGFLPTPGFGSGAYVIADQSYRPIGLVRGSYQLEGADLHELEITPEDTAIIAAYRPGVANLSAVGLSPIHPVLEAVIQEVDIPTGRVLFEWRGLEHVSPAESYWPAQPGAPYDYFHINSIDVDTDGNLLVSARHTHTVYKIDRRSGEVIWRLGGKNSDFTMGPGAGFSWQHDARRAPDGTISIFDNAAAPGVPVPPGAVSRGITLRLDETDRTAELERSDTHPRGLLAGSQGSYQVMPDGNSFVGFGAEEFFTEFGPDGEVRFDASFTNPSASSYRALRFEWTGRPAEPPIAVARNGPGAGMTVFASWNGATEVATWRVLAGELPAALRPVADAPRAGFETAIPVAARSPFVAVQALAADGTVLGTSIPFPLLP